MEDEELMHPEPDADQMGGPSDGDADNQFEPSASPAAREAITMLRRALDDPDFDPVIDSILTGAADVPKAVGTAAAMVLLGVGDRLPVQGDDLKMVAAHIVADLMDLFDEGGVEEASDPQNAAAATQEALRLMSAAQSAGQGADEMPEEEIAAPQAKRPGFARRVPTEMTGG